MNITAYIIINLLLFTSWYILLYRKKEYISFADRLIGTFVLCLTQIIATEMLLGVLLKKLYAMPLFFLNILISTGVLIFAFFTARDATSHNKSNTIKSIFDEFKDETIRFFRIIKNDWILFCIFGLFFISICWMIFIGYLFPSYTWDALWYHLPIVGYIMQSGAIQEFSNHSLIDQFINIFPRNIELFFLWNIIFLQNDVITDLSQLLFTIMGVLTIYSIAIKMKIKEKYAIYSSLLFFFMPVMILQSTTNYVDIAVSVLFLIAVNFLICNNLTNYTRSNKELLHLKQRKLLLLTAGLTTGILLGSKGSGPLFVGVMSVAVIIQEFVRHNKSSKFIPLKRCNIMRKSFEFYFIYFMVPVLIMGSYWYIKNWIFYSNPVYPMEVSFFNVTIFKGLYKGMIDPAPVIFNNLSAPIKLSYVWLEKVENYLYNSRLSGLGPLWFILFLPSLVFSLVFVVIEKKNNFLAISLILIITFLLYPRNWNPRYVIFIVGLGALSFGFAIDYFNRREKVLSIIALLLSTYTFFTANSPCVMPAKIEEFLQLPVRERTIAQHAPLNIDLHASQEYGYWIWISNNISKGDTLAYTFEPLFLSPLWNSAFSNKIAYVKSDNYKEWLKNLKGNDAIYILVRQYSQEDKWIEKERSVYHSLRWLGNITEKFKVVYTDKNYKIVKFMEGRRMKDEG